MIERAVLADDKRLAFILAGNAIVTLQSAATGKHFTYKVSRKKNGESVWFLSVLTGPGPDTFSFAAVISNDGSIRLSRNSQFSADAVSIKGWIWFWSRLISGRQTDGVLCYHEGRCGACNRRLTVPDSIRSGIGPVCATKLMAA